MKDKLTDSELLDILDTTCWSLVCILGVDLLILAFLIFHKIL